MLVMMAISGRMACPRARIWPNSSMPVSITAAWWVLSRDSRVNGAPMSPLRFPGVLRVR